jgi:hypothetical protein
MVMENTASSLVKPDILRDNKVTIHSFLRESYDIARKQLHHGVTYFREEFISLQDKTSQCIERMLLPVNNFLKDIAQMEAEFRQELNQDPANHVYLGGQLLPVEKVLSQPMEENY